MWASAEIASPMISTEAATRPSQAHRWYEELCDILTTIRALANSVSELLLGQVIHTPYNLVILIEISMFSEVIAPHR